MSKPAQPHMRFVDGPFDTDVPFYLKDGEKVFKSMDVKERIRGDGTSLVLTEDGKVKFVPFNQLSPFKPS